MDLGIGLSAGQIGIEIGEHEVGHRQAERTRQLARDELRDERARSLTGAAEFQHVHSVVVGLDDRRERPAFAKWRDVAGDANRLQRGHGDIVSRAPPAAERAACADAGWRAASLGPNVLRFETAGIAGLTLARALLRAT